MKAWDFANFAGIPTPAQVQAIKADGYDLALIQGLPRSIWPYTAEQVKVCADGGMAVDLYVYPYYANGERDAERRLEPALSVSHLIRRVALDVEENDASSADWTPGQRWERLLQWLEQCRAFPQNDPRGAFTYTAWWYLRDYLGWASQREAPCPLFETGSDLWFADYGSPPGTFKPFGGWNDWIIHQHTGTSTLHGVPNVDLNLVSDAEAAAITAYLSGAQEPAMPDEFTDREKDLINKLGYIGGDLVNAAEAELNRKSVKTGRLLSPRRAVLLPIVEKIKETAA